MKKTFLIIITSAFISSNLYSQDNNDLAAAAIIGLAASAAAIEQHKENLETFATNYILSNHREYVNFRLKAIGFGSGGKAWSDNGTLSFFPFYIQPLNKGELSGERDLLICFASSGWANDFGIDITKLKWKILKSDEWEKLMFELINLSSPIELNNQENKIQSFDIEGRLSKKPEELDREIIINKVTEKKSMSDRMNDKKTKKIKYVYEMWRKDEELFHISQIKIKASGVNHKTKRIVPFYELNGDDYLTKDYDDSFIILSNEKNFGLFVKDTEDFVLISRILINRINEELFETTNQ